MKFAAVGCAVLCLAGALAAMPARAQADTALPTPTYGARGAQAGAAGQAYTLPPDKLEKAIALGRIRAALDIGGSLWGLLVLWLLLQTRAAAGLGGRAERVLKRRWMQGLLFFAVLLLILTVAGWLVDAAGHAASLHYGISVQGWPSWLGDEAKALALTVGLGSPILLFFHWIVRVSPRRFWLWGWAAAVVLMILGTFVEPLAEPIFNEYEPLAKSHPALVAKLEEVVKRTGIEIPPDRMYLMKASVKSNGLNAYVSGLGATKRIVVWDTTAGRVPDDEVMFVFAHESGHYVLHHIPQGLALSAAAMFFGFWLCAEVAGRLARRWGARWGLGDEDAPPLASRAGAVVLLLVASAAIFLNEPLANAVSRHYEHEADIYGQEAIHGLVPDPQATAVKGFNALGAAWLEDPNPNRFVVFWTYDHPSIQERATFAAHYDPWKDGGRGEFFSK
jgi:Zn-dependent protease with chaperone function